MYDYEVCEVRDRTRTDYAGFVKLWSKVATGLCDCLVTQDIKEH